MKRYLVGQFVQGFLTPFRLTLRIVKAVMTTLRENLAPLLEVLGATALATGVALVYLPAGLVLAGGELIFFAQAFDRGEP